MIEHLVIFHITIGPLPQVIIAIIAFLFLAFFYWYLVPYFRVHSSLGNALSKIRSLKVGKREGELITREDIGEVFSDKYFEAVWHAYRDSLHEQKSYQNGVPITSAIRTTVPAEGIFSSQTLVDSQLNVEFFKHLPGILTGIGIIGTFFGLITGVSEFGKRLPKIQPGASDSVGSVQSSSIIDGLSELFVAVEGAFIASAAAILLAMLITFLEKLLLTRCYRKLEDLCSELNTLYEAGVGEDYLSQLVQHAEETSTQTRLLKQELVSELSVILQTLTEQQIKQWDAFGEKLASKLDERFLAAEKQNTQIAGLLGRLETVLLDERKEHDRRNQEFRADLGAGLDKIGERVAGITENQGERVTEQLEKIVSKFLETMQSTFGNRMEELASAVGNSVNSMQSMQDGFKSLVEDLRSGGAAERNAIVAAMEGLLQHIRDNQDKSSQELDIALKNTAIAIDEMMRKMEADRKSSSDEENRQRDLFNKSATDAQEATQKQVDALAISLGETLTALQENTAELKRTSLDAIKSLSQGAQMMSMAAGDFTKAGEKVAQSVTATSNLQQDMVQSSESLKNALDAINQVLAQYQDSQSQVAAMVEVFRELLAQAKNETGLGQKTVEDMRSMVSSFGVLKDDMDDFVDAVAKLLSDEYGKFVGSVNLTNQEFHKQIGTAVEQLGNALQQQSVSTQGLVDMISKSRK